MSATPVPAVVNGYRELTQAEVDEINKLKSLELETLDSLVSLYTFHGVNIDALNLAEVRIKEGFMWAVRSIARPNGE
jgi:hypothetical protein